MKPTLLRLSLLLLAISFAGALHAATPGAKAHHVVIIWLKQHGDTAAQQQYIEASKRLSKLPGVLAYNIGTPASIKRDRPSSAVDTSYDVAISSTFENQQALENYLKNPEYSKTIHEVLKPLVDKYKVYDFVE